MDKPVANMVLVPREPTDEMLRACWNLHHPWKDHAPAPEDRADMWESMKGEVCADWAAMVSAAPQPSLEGEVGEMVERLQTYRPPDNEWGDKTHHSICDEAAALLQSLSADNTRLREIVSESAAALPNGAFILPEATLDFMAKLPDEIRSVCARLDTQGGGNG